MTEWEQSREQDEFMRAAVLYKPSNSSLYSRFTRAKHEDDSDSVEVTRDQEVSMPRFVLYTNYFTGGDFNQSRELASVFTERRRAGK